MEKVTFSLGDAEVTVAAGVAELIRDDLDKQLSRPVPPSDSDALDDDHPLWEEYSGGDRHRGPQWGPSDLERARRLLRELSPGALRFFEVLLERPGRRIPSTEIAERAGFGSAYAVAGALKGFAGPCERAERVFPFFWWGSSETPTRYAVKPSVAGVFHAARAN